MAKVTCSKSGIRFSCDHVPMSLESRELSHPIFYLKKKKLAGLYAKWGMQDSGLTEIDEYLLFLAMLDSTELVEFRTPAEFIPKITTGIVNSYMERLSRIAFSITNENHPKLHLAHLIIGSDNKTLQEMHVYLSIWENNYTNFLNNYDREQEREDIKEIEREMKKDYGTNIQLIIENQYKNPRKFASIISNWAEKVANFPSFQVTHPLSKQQVKCSEYWKDIIKACVTEERIFEYLGTEEGKDDYITLYEQCETLIPSGSTYQATLLDLLKHGYKTANSYLGGDLLETPQFRILDARTSVEDANMLAIIDAAPKEMPVKANYPSLASWIKAKLAYQKAQAYLANPPPTPQQEMELRVKKQEEGNANLPKVKPAEMDFQIIEDAVKDSKDQNGKEE